MKVQTKNQMDYVKHNFIPIKNKLLNKYSPAETHFEQLLLDAHIYFRREKCNFKYDTRWSYFDYYLPYYKIYIEIDGASHNTEEQKKIDKEKLDVIRRRQAYLLRIKNEDVLKMDSISIDQIKDMLFNYLGRTSRSHGRDHYEKRYNEVMQKEYAESIRQMSEALEDTSCVDKEVWLYQRDMDAIFKFENIFESKLCTKLGINEIAELLSMDYKRNLNRKYIFAHSEEECKARMILCYS
jgi:very-short-patch-repair endonuclease